MREEWDWTAEVETNTRTGGQNYLGTGLVEEGKAKRVSDGIVRAETEEDGRIRGGPAQQVTRKSAQTAVARSSPRGT